MSEKQEKSGMEILEEMKNKLELMDRRLANMELMLKQLLSRANIGEKLQAAPAVINATISATKTEKPNIIPVTTQEAKIGDMPAGKNGKIKVIGQIQDKQGRRLSGVKVSVFDNNKNLVKNTASNRAGEWMSLLPTGRYRAEYFLENVINSSVDFSVTPGQTLVRLAQPTK